MAECEWVETDEGLWEHCAGEFVFNDGGPSDNGFKHCPYCGSPLKEDPFEEEEPSDER